MLNKPVLTVGNLRKMLERFDENLEVGILDDLQENHIFVGDTPIWSDVFGEIVLPPIVVVESKARIPIGG